MVVGIIKTIVLIDIKVIRFILELEILQFYGKIVLFEPQAKYITYLETQK